MPVADKVTVELELLDAKYKSKLDANAIVFDRQMKRMEKDAQKAADQIEASLGRVPDSLKAKYRELGADIGRSFAGISRGAQLAFGAITAYSLKLASDAAEIESAFQVAFGSATEDVKTFSEQLGETAGRDAVVLRESMTRLQLVLTGTGVEAKKSAELVKALSTAGVDAGSLFNTSDAEALQKIISGLTGESEPLKAFGVVLTEAAVKAELLRLGFKGNVDAASEASKAIARTNLILKGLAVAQGDAERTSGSAANTTKRMTAEFNKAARDLGTELLPAMTKLFGIATDVLTAFNNLDGGTQVLGLGFLALIAAGGPIAGMIANLARLRLIALETKVALAALGVGGAGGAATRGLIAGGVAGAAGLGGALLVGTGSFKEQNERTPEVIRSNLDATRRLRSGDTRTIRFLEQELAGAIRQRDLRTSMNEIAYGTGAYAPGPSAADSGVVGGFGLGDLANGTASGGRGGRGRASTGPSDLEIAARRAALELQNSLNLAEAEGRRADAEGYRRQIEINQLTEEFATARIDNARALATAQVDAIRAGEKAGEEAAKFAEQYRKQLEKEQAELEAINRENERRLQFQLSLARASGDDARILALERELSLLQRINDLGPGREGEARAEEGQLNRAEDDAIALDRGREMARSFIDVVRSDNIGQAIGDRFKQAAFDGIESYLSRIFASLFQSGGQGGGSGISSIISAGAKILGFGGGRASGGPVRAGFSYDVGENGREKFVAPANGFIMPNMGAQAKSASPQSITVKQSFDLTGVTGDAAIYGNVSRMIAQGQRQTLAIVKTSAPSAQLEQRLLRD